MARFVDLEVEDGGDDAQDPSSRFVAVPPPTGPGVEESATTPTVCNAVTRAFQCYPIVVGVVSHIDLTTLDSLARASRLIHIGLVQYRAALVAATLRCANEQLPVDPDAALRFRVARAEVASDAASSAKASRCARDMVGECRRCATVICRNCTIKPPAASTLRERHRRLCAPCAKAPLERVACPGLDMSLPGSADSMHRSLCDCEAGGVWLCQPCGRDIRNADQDYLRIWRWRNHYGEVLGCLGTGIGDADRGVICGREDRCLASREREQEVDCDAEDARSSSSSSRTPSTSSEHHPATPTGGGSYFPVFAASTTPTDPDSIEALVAEYATAAAAARTPSPPLSLGPGYARHEIEGIGGVVKRKLVRMVRVGRCVPEWEEERASVTRILGREARGEARSWCGWCWRVVPGRGDLLPGEGASSSSSLPLRPAAGMKTQSRPPLVPVLDVRAGA